jgi:(2Fe-2S) ferredoxin
VSRPDRERLLTVTVCRGCCCGTDKHPDVDHEAQLATLRTGLAGNARVRVSDCLDACERSNVVVVQPSPAGRAAGGRSAWLGGVLDPEVVAYLADRVGAGGPGVVAPPAALRTHIGPPPSARGPD